MCTPVKQFKASFPLANFFTRSDFLLSLMNGGGRRGVGVQRGGYKENYGSCMHYVILYCEKGYDVSI